MKEIKEKVSIVEKISRAIDVLITPFSARTAFMRKMERSALSRATSYRSAGTSRINDTWITTGGSADADLLQALPVLREKSRDLTRNDAHAAGIIATVVTNVVGMGIRPQSRVDDADLSIEKETVESFQNQAEASWHRWVEFADAAGVLDFYGVQTLVERQILENGEVFIIPLMIKTPDSPYMTRLQIVEADRVETPAELRSNKNVRSGIEVDKLGRPVAYYVRKSHPGDPARNRRHTGTSIENYIKYPALNELGRKNVYHLYYMKRPGQTRGEPFFAPVINYFKDLSDYMEAELVAAKVAACFSVFIKKLNPGTAAFNNTARVDNNQRIETLSPGIVEYLQTDEDIVFANPNRPGTNFAPFVEQILRSIAAALNMPFEVVARDFTRSSYSSARAALQEARRFFRERQKFLERELCQPVWELVLEEAFLMGEVPAVEFYQNKLRYCRARWISPGWGWIDPTKEVDAARSAIEGNLSTLADEAAALGKDWAEILEQLAKENKKKQELGIKDTPTVGKKTLIEEKSQEEEVPAKSGNN